MGELGVDITIEELDPRTVNKDIVSKIFTQANIKIPEEIDITSLENWKKQHNNLLEQVSKNIAKKQQGAGNTSDQIIASLFSEELRQACAKFLAANPDISQDPSILEDLSQLSKNEEIREILRKIILENIKKDPLYFRNLFIQKGFFSSPKYTTLCIHFIQKDFLEKTSSRLLPWNKEHTRIKRTIQKIMEDKESSMIELYSELEIDPEKYMEEKIKSTIEEKPIIETSKIEAKSIMEKTLANFFGTLSDVTLAEIALLDVKKEEPKRTEKTVKERSKPGKKLDEIAELKVEIAKKLWEINDEQDFNQKKKEIKALINENIDKLREAAEKKESSPLTSDLESIVHMLRINDLERFNKKFSDRVTFDNFDRKKWIKSLKLNFTERRKFHKARTDTKSVDPKPAENSHSSSRKFALFQKKTSSEVARIKKLIKEEIKKPFKKR